MKFVVLLFYILTNLTLNSFSQITIKEVEKNIHVESLKPPPYDSLTNYQDLEDITRELSDYEIKTHYLKYIGLKIYLPPCYNNNSKEDIKECDCVDLFTPKPNKFKLSYSISGNDSAVSFLFKPISFATRDNPDYDNRYNFDVKTRGEEVRNKYYTILDVYNAKSADSINETMNTVYSHILNEEKKIAFEKHLYDYEMTRRVFVLKDEITNDTLYVKNSLNSFILVPYFLKQKQLYNSKLLVSFIYSERLQDKESTFTDLKTEEKFKTKRGIKWTCEVALLERSKVPLEEGRSEKGDGWGVFFILRNENHEIAIETLLNEYHYAFMLNDEFVKLENERKLKEGELIAKQKRELQKENEVKLQYKQTCIVQFGQEMGELIASGKVKIGMTTEMCKAAWGNPFDKSKTITSSTVIENWFFSWRRSLHFVNSILTRIDE